MQECVLFAHLIIQEYLCNEKTFSKILGKVSM